VLNLKHGDHKEPTEVTDSKEIVKFILHL